MSEVELCGEPTSSGKPCNMPKDHGAKFHRHREYDPPMEWVIKDAKSQKILESGNTRKAFNFATTYWLKKGISLVMEVEP